MAMLPARVLLTLAVSLAAPRPTPVTAIAEGVGQSDLSDVALGRRREDCLADLCLLSFGDGIAQWNYVWGPRLSPVPGSDSAPLPR